MKRSKGFQLIYCLTLAVFLISGAALAVRLAELRCGNVFYRRAEEMPAAPTSGSPDPSAAPTARPAVPKTQERDSVPEPHALSLCLAQFAERYPDAAIWIQLPGTPLNYPVMRGTDNRFYLNHLPDGSKNALGSLFLDYRTNADSPHLIVYGHNGSGGKMFGLLGEYESQDYFLTHKTLTVATADAVYVCPIFSVRRVEADSDAYRLEFKDSGSLRRYIDQAAEASLYQIDVEADGPARVLTLSTCTRWGGQRLIVQALLPCTE